MFMNNDAIQRMDLRLVLFLRLHKMDELNCMSMSASGKRWNYATACISLDERLSARLASVTFAHKEEGRSRHMSQSPHLTRIAGGDCGRDDCPAVFTTDRG